MKKLILNFLVKSEILQAFADSIIVNMQMSTSKKMFEFWMSAGLNLDLWCTERGIYLK